MDEFWPLCILFIFIARRYDTLAELGVGVALPSGWNSLKDANVYYELMRRMRNATRSLDNSVCIRTLCLP